MTLGVKNINSLFLIRIVIAIDDKKWHKKHGIYRKITESYFTGKSCPVGPGSMQFNTEYSYTGDPLCTVCVSRTEDRSDRREVAYGKVSPLLTNKREGSITWFALNTPIDTVEED